MESLRGPPQHLTPSIPGRSLGRRAARHSRKGVVMIVISRSTSRLGRVTRVAVLTVMALLAVTTACVALDGKVFLNAFGETATAYLNDSFLLLGATADEFVADIIPAQVAMEIGKNVQKRVRRIRTKLKAASESSISDVDRQLIGLLDHAYACMDTQAQALAQYVEENKSPEAARRFETQRLDCLNRLKKITEFYSTLPPSPDTPEPLSTR